MDETAVELIAQTPDVFDLDAFEEKFPTMYEESRNTVAKQEAVKYNRLLALLKVQLPLFRRAVKGLVVMTDDLEQVGKGLFMNVVPEVWAAVGFLSLKPLTAYYKDLNMRVDFFNKWYAEGHPIAFWLSGMFFPQAFCTAVLQNFARARKFAIDRINFETITVDQYKDDGSDIKELPEAGQYMWGMFLEGCRWCNKRHVLAPSHPKQLFTPMPVVLFKPMLDWIPTTSRYPCPIYKVLSRKGTLSTTGHSTNFVRDMEVDTDCNPDDWIRAGVACFLGLKY
jgi:dynein heavy chain